MIWGFDTETDHDGTRAWVVQWVLWSEDRTYRGTDLRALRHIFEKLGQANQKNYIYIHNLKYDIEFIKYILWDIVQEGLGELTPIFRQGQPIQVTLSLKNGRMLVFRDSAKKWQGNLRSLGDAIGCPKLENVDPEFHAGWSKMLDLDDEESWRYVTRDAEIAGRAGMWWHAQGAKKATTSGDAWSDLRHIIGYKLFDARYPKLTRAEDDALRQGYFGGINLSFNHGYVIKGPITHEDKVSMYPGVMRQKPLPYGRPVYLYGAKPDHGLWVGKQ